MRDKRSNFILVSISLVLATSLLWNAILLKDQNKLNLDSLKWAIKSFSFKYSDLVNGKIPLLKQDTNLPESIHQQTGSEDETYRNIISQASKYYSIFGLEPSNGYNGLPKGLPNWVAECGSKLGLDRNLYFVSYSNKPESEFVFFRGNHALTALTGSILKHNKCRIVSEITVQKSTKSWLIRQKTNFNISSDNLPAHFSIDDSGNAVLVSRLGELSYVNFGRNIELSKFQDLRLNLRKSIAHTHFGVKSVLFGKKYLYIAVARNEDSCNRLEIYSMPVLKASVDIAPEHRKTIYKSPGCFDSKTTELNAIGGRLIFKDSSQSNIIFSLGNAEIWTGLENIESKRQYGNIIELNIKSGRSQIISTGHRNPQGLCITKNGIYETEQGLDGGDEFNLIVKGKNYGWPAVSYGAPYGDFFSTKNNHRRFGIHDVGTKPLLSWVPAIAVGDLLCPNLGIRSPWNEDFIAATLKDQSIRRLVLDGKVIRVDERIPMSERIRDIQYSTSGNLISLTDSGAVIVLHIVSREIQ